MHNSDEWTQQICCLTHLMEYKLYMFRVVWLWMHQHTVAQHFFFLSAVFLWEIAHEVKSVLVDWLSFSQQILSLSWLIYIITCCCLNHSNGVQKLYMFFRFVWLWKHQHTVVQHCLNQYKSSFGRGAKIQSVEFWSTGQVF